MYSHLSAVVNMVSEFTLNDDRDLNTYSAGIHDFFDQVIVIGKTDTSLFVSSSTPIDAHLR